MNRKLDLTKLDKDYYTAKLKPQLIDLKACYPYLSILGKGDPSSLEFANDIAALYSTAYTLKFAFKAMDKDFTVAKLEGLWWFDEAKYPNLNVETALSVPRAAWEYRLLIRMPDYVKETAVKEAVAKAFAKKDIARIKEVHYFELQEGKCVQMMHVGAFDTEINTLKQIMAFCEEHDLQKNGLHHEIYLSDFRKTAPEKLKTILREPVK
jgi:hypothetical protein